MLIIPQTLKKFPSFYESWRIFTVFITVHPQPSEFCHNFWHTIFLIFFLILSAHLYISLPRYLFLFFFDEILNKFLISQTRYVLRSSRHLWFYCPNDAFNEENKLWNLSFHSFLQPSITPSFLDTDDLLSSLSADIRNFCWPLMVMDQILHP
jgi:hypothetical protein